MLFLLVVVLRLRVVTLLSRPFGLPLAIHLEPIGLGQLRQTCSDLPRILGRSDGADRGARDRVACEDRGEQPADYAARGPDDDDGRDIGDSAAERAAARRIEATLTRDEQRLFAMLLGAASMDGRGTTLRVAGGWVRDKLLFEAGDEACGNASSVDGARRASAKLQDVDVALDNQLGSEFATSLARFCEAHAGGGAAPAVALIASNPGKSKHLETATMSFAELGAQLDLVNLRAESYADSDDSRVPSAVRLGTPLEDAARRDLTINALFYNLETRKVEDWTGSGLRDLAGRVVRTPMASRTTLLDDPLRALRAVRFTARLGFALDDELRAAASSADVRAALGYKVSRERVGAEVDGMLRIRADAASCVDRRAAARRQSDAGADAAPAAPLQIGPDTALRLLLELGLLPRVLFDLDALQLCRHAGAVPDADGVEECGAWAEACPEAAWAAAVDAAAELTQLVDGPGAALADEAHRRLAFYAVLVRPLAPFCVRAKRGRTEPAAKRALQDGLKLKHRDVDGAFVVRQAADAFSALLQDGGAPGVSRVAAGRVFLFAKELWDAALHAALAEALATEALASAGAGDAAARRGRARVEAAYAALRHRVVVELCLDRVWELKPLLDGTAVIRLLGLSGGGPAVAHAMEDQQLWTLEHADGAAEDCAAFLLDRAAQRLTGAIPTPRKKPPHAALPQQP
ncbi:hypothetical protein M885DRAFT_474183 [Pelagophyceae sp. CCMP2097]|nr:hypothetical protein M885DRAFT_474183 [Pelagophyceae sp. CCMP2097]